MLRLLPHRLARLALPFLLAAATGGSAAAAEPQQLVIGTGAVAGVSYPMGGALCRAVNKLRPKASLRCLVESTDGSVANLKALAAGDLDMAIVQSDWQRQFVTGTGSFASPKPDTELRSILSLYPEVLAIAVRAKDPINSVEDLRGRKVIVGEPRLPLNPLLVDLLTATGIERGEFSQVIEMPNAEQPRALCDGKADAVVAVVAHPSAFVAAAMGTCPVRLLEIKGEAVDQMLKTRPHLAAATLAANTYPGQPQPIASFGIRSTLVARAALPAESAEALVAAVLAELESIRQMHPAFSGIDRATMGTAALSAPLHPGARKALMAAGIAVPLPEAGGKPPSAAEPATTTPAKAAAPVPTAKPPEKAGEKPAKP